jgi:drug/metabolite transporter (DMT)-like permease
MTSLELGMVLLSALLHAAWNAYAKDTGSPTVFLAWLAIAHLTTGLLFLPFIEVSLVPDSLWAILGVSALFHTAYNFCLGRAYERAPLAVVYPISRSTPAVVALIAIPLLHDPVTPIGAAGIAVVMIGMWLVHTDGRIEWKALVSPGIGFAYLTLLTTAGYSLTDKMAMAELNAGWTGELPAAFVYFFLGSFAYAPLFVGITLLRVPRQEFVDVLKARWGKILFGLVASLASYILILHALRTASVSYVTAVRQSSVVFAALLSLVILRERPTRARMIGALLNVAGVALIAIFS